MNRIFQVSGGIGKNISFTSVLEKVKKTYPEDNIHVITAWPNIYHNLPFVCSTIESNSKEVDTIFQRLMLNQEYKTFLFDPYNHNDFINGTKHIIQIWSDLVDVDYNPQATPKLFISAVDKLAAEIMFSNIKLTFTDKNKPTILFQPTGGPGVAGQIYSWTRDIHPLLAQRIVDDLSKKYNIVCVSLETHYKLNNCYILKDVIDPKVLFAIAAMCDGRVLIDSSIQHAMAAFGLRSNVLWSTTLSTQFGYSLHNNIIPRSSLEVHTRFSHNAGITRYNLDGQHSKCPFTEAELLNLWDLSKIELPSV